jgi:hypothetical protein
LVSIGLVLSEEKIFEKVYDGRQVMRIAHMTLWVRWANNILSNNVHQFYNPTRVKPWHRILSVSSVFCVVLWGLSEDSYQVTFRLFSCFEFWCLRFCQKSNYQVTFRVFLFWVLVFEVLSAVTTRWHFVFSCFEFWCLRFCQK